MDSDSLSTALATELKLATHGESQACLFGSLRDKVYICDVYSFIHERERHPLQCAASGTLQLHAPECPAPRPRGGLRPLITLSRGSLLLLLTACLFYPSLYLM